MVPVHYSFALRYGLDLLHNTTHNVAEITRVRTQKRLKYDEKNESDLPLSCWQLLWIQIVQLYGTE